MSVVILKADLLDTLQDRGRHGHAAFGVGASGAMDEVSLRLANALAGNGDDATAIEFTAIGPTLRFERDATIALTGAPFDARIGDVAATAWRPLPVRAGDVLDLGRAREGLRGYLAVAGGFDADRVLGSASTDLNAGLGPFGGHALRKGDALAIGATAPSPARHGDTRLPAHWSLDPRPWFDADPARPIHLIRGSHFDALDAASQHALFHATFRIASDSNRVGLRLDGASLALRAPLELVSEAVAFGTVQLPPGGQPIALMAEHPTTGGYPRIAQVAAVDLPRLAQRRPGATLHFAEIGLDAAQTRYLRRERALAELIEAIARRLGRPDQAAQAADPASP